LREAIAEFEAEKMKHYKDPQVLVTCGGEAALYMMVSAFVGPGDEYIIPSTCFAPYKLIAACLRVKAVYVDFEDPDALANAVTDKTKLILVNSPNNP
jgi:aspartate/methionine/tyrosine aminotransferase